MKYTKELTDYILAEMETSDFDTICDDYNKRREDDKEIKEITRTEIVKQVIEDLFSTLEIDDAKINEIIDGDLSFSDEFDDNVREWADSQVDIYTYTLWQKGAIFSDYTEDALDEFGFDKERGLPGLLMSGQYMFWSNLGNSFLSLADDWKAEPKSEDIPL